MLILLPLIVFGFIYLSSSTQTLAPFASTRTVLQSCQGCQTNEFGEYLNPLASWEPGENWDNGTANPSMTRHLSQAWTLTATTPSDGNPSLNDFMMTKIFSAPLDLSKFSSDGNWPSDDNDFIDLWGYQHDLNINAGSIHLDASPPGQEWTDYFSYFTFGENTTGWRYLHIKKSDFAKTGNPNWNSIKRLRISMNAKPGTTAQFTFDNWRHVSSDTTFTPVDARQGVNIRCQANVNIENVLRHAKIIGAEWVRVPFYWNEIESTPGQFNYTTTCSGQSYLTLVDKASKARLSILAIIYGTPAWAEKSGCDGLNCPPENPNSIKPFLANIKSRFGSKIKYWEIWNEPNSPGFFIGENAEEYVNLLRAAYEQIQQKDPSDTVVMGGIFDNGELPIPWMENFYAAGGGSYAEVMAFHPYTSQQDPNQAISMQHNNLRGHVRAMRAIMAAHGDTIENGKELWVTESGFTTGGSGPVSETTQGQWSVDAYNIVSNSRSAQNFFMYELVNGQDQSETPRSHEGNFGFLSVSGSTLAQKASYGIIQTRYNAR